MQNNEIQLEARQSKFSYRKEFITLIQRFLLASTTTAPQSLASKVWPVSSSVSGRS